MKMKFVFALALFSAPIAFAGEKDTPQGPDNTRPLNWEEFKQACQDPEAFQVQRPPENIRITCGDRSNTWKAVQSGSIDLPTGRSVRTSLMSDKFSVAAQDNQIDTAPVNGACPRFVETEETLVTERAVTCSEILAYQGDLQDFCRSVIDAARSENPDLVTSRETGRLIDTCGSSGDDDKKKKKK